MANKKPVRIKPFFSRHLSPERIFILGFAAYILLGALLLWLPFSATKGHLILRGCPLLLYLGGLRDRTGQPSTSAKTFPSSAR